MLDKMRQTLLIALTLTASIVACAEDTSPLQPLPFKSKVEVLSADGKQVVAVKPPRDRAIAGVWSLGDENITTEITEAYRYHGYIVVFGWAGNYNGIATILDANTGTEKLELLVNERSRFITVGGTLIYAHWFVKGAYEPDDSLWMLDLNHPFARPKSGLGRGNVVDEIGARIYPLATDPNIKHQFGGLVVTRDGRDVFVADRPVNPAKPAELCFVHIGISDANHPIEKRSCVNERLLTGYVDGEFGVAKLALRSDGALVYSVSSAGESGAKNEEFTIDKDTMSPTMATSRTPTPVTGPESNTPPLRVPWGVEKSNLNDASAIDVRDPVFAGHLQDSIAVRLLISTTGSVLSVALSGCTGELEQKLRSVLGSWSFKPTILNGRRTEVQVVFKTPIGDLARKP